MASRLAVIATIEDLRRHLNARARLLKYDPDQPRVPSGQTGGGQWTSGAGGAGGATPGQATSGTARPGTMPFPSDAQVAPLVAMIRQMQAGDETAQAELANTLALPIRPGHPVVMGGLMALSLLQWLTSRPQSDPDGAVIARFTSRAYPVLGQELLVQDINAVSRSELERICPRYEEVQWRTNEAHARVSRDQPGLSPSQFGTAVHVDLSDQIKFLDNPDFVAERSFLKSDGERADYGEKNSIRVDVLEKTQNNTVCVYDIKTGKAPLWPGRSAEIATTVSQKFGAGKPIIVTEIRASQEKRR